MALQAYIDDSYTADVTFLLGGFIACQSACKMTQDWSAPLTVDSLQVGN
jgi:hypothetical protein